MDQWTGVLLDIRTYTEATGQKGRNDAGPNILLFTHTLGGERGLASAVA